MRLTSKSEYALLAAIDLAAAEGGAPLSSRTIAARREVPLKYLEQLLALLRQAGIVTSVRGAQGGYRLSEDPAHVTVLDVVEAVEGPLNATVCESAHTGADERGEGCPRQGACAAAAVWSRATEVLKKEFRAVTLDSLAKRQTAIDARTKEMQG